MFTRANPRLKLKKSRQPLIRVHNKTLAVIAMRGSNPGRSPVGIHCCDVAPTPTGFAEIVSDDRNDSAS